MRPTWEDERRLEDLDAVRCFVARGDFARGQRNKRSKNMHVGSFATGQRTMSVLANKEFRLTIGEL